MMNCVRTFTWSFFELTLLQMDSSWKKKFSKELVLVIGYNTLNSETTWHYRFNPPINCCTYDAWINSVFLLAVNVPRPVLYITSLPRNTMRVKHLGTDTVVDRLFAAKNSRVLKLEHIWILFPEDVYLSSTGLLKNTLIWNSDFPWKEFSEFFFHFHPLSKVKPIAPN